MLSAICKKLDDKVYDRYQSKEQKELFCILILLAYLNCECF